MLFRILNALVFISMGVYVFFPGSHPVWNIFGIGLILVFIINPVVAYRGSRSSVLDKTYLVLFSLFMLVLPFYNYVRGSTATIISLPAFPAVCMVLLPLLIGFFLPKRPRNAISSLNEQPEKISRKAITILHAFLPLAIGVLGCFLGFYLTFSRDSGLIGIFGSQFSGILGFSCYGFSVLAAKILKSRRWISRPVLGMGLLGLFLSLLPMLAMPFAIAYSDREFETAFGSVSSIVPPEKYGGFFLASAFVIPEYFLGRDADSCRVRRDIVYYQEAGVTLRFDVYLPPRKDDTTPASPMETMAPKEAPDLPGKNAVLVRIHGGAWVTGDKGAGNSAAMNAYFASRGYAVFDIQYGLNSRAHFHLSSPTPSDVMGDFSIDDMVRQIGLFLKYLKLHADEYDADVSCVFLSGGSAGGQLAIAAGLAPEHPEFRGMTEPGLVIRGIIPFYPANGFAKKMGMEGTPRLVDPTALLTRESPPFLLYQGTHDGLVSMANTEAFYQHYQSVVGKKIALIAMPLAGHGSDLYFSGYYNQVFLYYMERFMYLGVTSNFDK